MFFRWLFGSFVLLPICFTSSTVAQITPLIVSEPCKNVQSVSVSDLDRKMMSLRATLDNLKRTRAKLLADANAQRQELDKKIRANQEALIELTFALECHRRDLQDDPVVITDAEGGAPTRGPSGGLTAAAARKPINSCTLVVLSNPQPFLENPKTPPKVAAGRRVRPRFPDVS